MERCRAADNRWLVDKSTKTPLRGKPLLIVSSYVLQGQYLEKLTENLASHPLVSQTRFTGVALTETGLPLLIKIDQQDHKYKNSARQKSPKLALTKGKKTKKKHRKFNRDILTSLFFSSLV